MKIRYPEYFQVKATTVIPYTCGLTSVDVKKYQQSLIFRLMISWVMLASQEYIHTIKQKETPCYNEGVQQERMEVKPIDPLR